MPKASKPGYYAVRIGRVPGIYHSWADCEAQVKGFAGAMYKKLNTEAEAIEFVSAKPGATRTFTSCDVAPAASTCRVLAVPEPTAHPKPVKAALPAPKDEGDCDIVYCDGACRGNGKVGSIAGVGVWWGHGDPRNISERCPGDQTNNRAELIAIVRLLETTPRLKRRLLIKTDSKYSIECITSWIFKWMRNGFLATDGKPVKNRALVKYLAALLHVRRRTSQAVEFKHVRGHVGIEGNEAADQLANLGATKSEVPERDWETLEKEALRSLDPVKPVKEVHDDLEVYVDGLLSDDELTEWVDTTVGSVELPIQESKPQHSVNQKTTTWDQTSGSLVPREVLPPRAQATGLSAPRTSNGTISMRSGSKPSSKSSSGSTVVALGPYPTPSQKLMTAINKEEPEAYASCLLGDNELSTLGKDGVFDSDF